MAGFELDVDMALALNKKFFKRNRQRETEFGAFFNKTSTNLNYLMGLIITIFLFAKFH